MNDIDANKQWYAIYIGDQRNTPALSAAIKSISPDFNVWVPTEEVYLKVDCKTGPKLRKMVRPLFPKYAFLYADVNLANIDDVIKTTCGGYLLKVPGGESPKALTDAEMQHVRELANERKNPQSIANRYDFRVGQKIEVTKGPFMGMMGKLHDIKKKLIVVELNIMGQDVLTEIDPDVCFIIKE